MIKLEIDVMVALYLIVGIIILVLWIAYEWRKRPSLNTKNDSLWECPTCFHVYVDSSSGKISRCPKCQTLHRKREKE